MFDTKKLEGIKINLKSLKLEIVFCNAKILTEILKF